MINSPPVSLALVAAQILAWRFWRAALPPGRARTAASCLYLAVNAMSVSVLLNWYWTVQAPPANPLVWTWFYRPVLIWQLVHLAWLALTALSLSVHGLIRAVLPRPRGASDIFKAKRSRPRLAPWRVALLAILAAAAARGYLMELEPPQVMLAEARIRSLPPALEGLTVALVSDLRYGRSANPSDLARFFNLLAHHRPDLVISAGNLVEKGAALASDFRIPVAALAPPRGFYAVLGEAELDSDSPAALSAHLAQAGVDVLSDRGAAVSDLPLYLASLGGPGPEAEDLGPTLDFGALQGTPPPEGFLVVLVTRRPHPVDQIAGHGVGLYLAGPAGRLPLSWDPLDSRADALYGPGLGAGLHQAGDLVIALTRGLSGPIPLSLRRGPELTILTLRASPV
jgi:hypothetical protein